MIIWRVSIGTVLATCWCNLRRRYNQRIATRRNIAVSLRSSTTPANQLNWDGTRRGAEHASPNFVEDSEHKHKLPVFCATCFASAVRTMLPYQAVAMDYAVSSSLQRQTPIGLGVNINSAFTHSWFVPADLCVPYKQTPLLEPGHVILISVLVYFCDLPNYLINYYYSYVLILLISIHIWWQLFSCL